MQTCRDLASWLRDHQPELYERTADETESWLAVEVQAAVAADLGRVDTFRFEEEKVLTEALTALEQDRFQDVLAWHEAREHASFWLRRDPRRADEWRLVAELAALGRALQAAGTELAAASLAEAAQRYTAVGAPVDRAHRLLVQRLVRPLGNLPHLQQVKDRVAQLREAWRTWADRWSVQLNALCTAQGFLPDPSLQQRTLFDQVVRPFTQEPGVTAYFVVDALRYEMALTLLEAIDGTPATTVTRLVQLAGAGFIALIDALEVADLGPLGVLMADRNAQKVIHNASFERSVLAKHDIAIENVLDTLRLSREIRGKVDGGHSLKAVCARELGLEIDKTEQVSDWTRRPLTQSQQAYAAMDVELLLRLVDVFRPFSTVLH